MVDAGARHPAASRSVDAHPGGTGRGADMGRRRDYPAFLRAVGAASVAEWLPRPPAAVLDVAGELVPAAAQRRPLADRGSNEGADPGGDQPADAARDQVADPGGEQLADRLAALPDSSYDGVLAQGAAISRCLAADVVFAEFRRVLRPGGRLLLCVDSLVGGLAALAAEGRWAELADAPEADVVFVPQPGGTITRCFWQEELTALLVDAGLAVDWIRPRPVLPPDAVERTLSVDPHAFDRLVRAEIRLECERRHDAVGGTLVAGAHRR